MQLNSFAMKSKSVSSLIALALLLVASGTLVHAQVAPAATAPAPAAPAANLDTSGTIYEPFTIRLGGFLLSNINTTLSLSNSSGQVGDEIDFVNALGGKDSLNVFRADAEWQFAAKHKVQLAFFDINLEASKSISKEIHWGDQVFPVNATLNSQFKTTVYKLNYGYIFHKTAKHEVSFLAGLHITSITTGLSMPNLGKAEKVSVTAPLPVFGFEWKAQLAEKLTSYMSYQYFGLSYDDKYKGSLSDFQALLDYHFTPNWSLGAGFNRYVMNARVKSERDLELKLKHNYNGLLLFVSTSF
jgi:hypothetical protein